MKPLLPYLFLFFPALGACRAPHAKPAVPVVVPQAGAPLQPPSVLAACVRLLEATEAFAAPNCVVQVRALEADALLERSAPTEIVRAFLHLTVFGTDVAQARGAMDELERVLGVEASAVGRDEELSGDRIRRVFSAGVWRAPPREDWVSYSAALRFEVAPGRILPPGERAAPAFPAARAATESAQSYVEDISRELVLPVRAIAPRVQAARSSAGHASEMRCTLRPAEPDPGHTAAAIAAFVRELEARSPAARITHLLMERSSELADVLRDDAWTFEAELTLRVPAATE